jgi:hypothetical protein
MYITRAPVACKRMGGCELLSHLPQSIAPQQQERHLQVRSDEYPDASGPEDSYCDLLLAARHQVFEQARAGEQDFFFQTSRWE